MFSNALSGCYVEYALFVARNNLVFANGSHGFDTLNGGALDFENNTVALNAGVGLKLWGSYGAATILNNIFYVTNSTQTCLQFQDISQTWQSDYNDYFVSNGATLWNWKGARFSLGMLQYYTTLERHSLDIDPQLDAQFRLQPGSLCIDAGDPLASYVNEPSPNGSRINLGRWGNTAQAETSGATRVVRVLYPNGGETTFRNIRVRWAATGPWATNDLVTVEYSANGGTNWSTAVNGASLNCFNGVFTWDVSALTPGSNYLVRLRYPSGTASDASDQAFTILDPSGKTFYVNDGSTLNDQWCSAIGSATNSGLSGASPIDSLQHLIERYPALGPGDEVRVDAGSYEAGRTVYFNSTSSGTAGGYFVIRGNTNGLTVFNRGDLTDDVFYLQGISWLRLQNLTIQGGVNGVNWTGSGSTYVNGPQIVNCNLNGNTADGLALTFATNALAVGNLASQNASVGLSLGSSFSSLVASNTFRSNAGDGLDINGSGSVFNNACCSNNGGWGLTVSGAFQVYSNEVFRNTYNGFGVWVGGSDVARVAGNWSHDNSSYSGHYGLLISGASASAISNRVNGNVGIGLRVESGALAQYNVVSANGGHGIDADDWASTSSAGSQIDRHAVTE